MAIVNTSTDPLSGTLVLLDGLAGGDGSGAIERMEAQGQAQLVASTQLPSEMGDQTAYEALGFTFGAPTPGDELFREATLPEGWVKRATDHDMWTEIVDPLGRKRVAVFYKAAFYDRRAHMRIESHRGYLSDCLYDKREPVLDDAWLTREAAIAELTQMHAVRIADRDRMTAMADERSNDELRGYAAEYDKEAAAIKALIDRLTA